MPSYPVKLLDQSKPNAHSTDITPEVAAFKVRLPDYKRTRELRSMIVSCPHHMDMVKKCLIMFEDTPDLDKHKIWDMPQINSMVGQDVLDDKSALLFWWWPGGDMGVFEQCCPNIEDKGVWPRGQETKEYIEGWHREMTERMNKRAQEAAKAKQANADSASGTQP